VTLPWLEAKDESLPQRVLRSPLAPIGFLYGLGARMHRASYRLGLRTPRRLACRVVSVGNLVVGGSGKTPLAAWLARSLRERGHRAVLASRGYGRKRHESVTVVSDGRVLCCDPDLAGDEPLVLSSHAPGVPVLVGRDRGLVGLHAVAMFGAEVLVLDDGFQHHRLESDVDIVAFDGAFGFGNRRVLPRGPLREPPSALGEADAVAIVDGPLSPDDACLVRRLCPDVRSFEARRRATGVRDLSGGISLPPDTLSGMEIGLIAGLARASGFRRTLEGLGARITAERRFPDHHRYRSRDLEGLRDAARVWLTTEKDAVKILPSWRRGADVRVLQMDLEVAEARPLLEWLEARLRA